MMDDEMTLQERRNRGAANEQYGETCEREANGSVDHYATSGMDADRQATGAGDSGTRANSSVKEGINGESSSSISEKIQTDAFAPTVDMQIDPGIRGAVLILRRAGIETFESCEGGPGHAFDMPTVRFHGNAWVGHKAFAAAMEHGLPVHRIQRAYAVVDGELEGPIWEIVFHKKGLP